MDKKKDSDAAKLDSQEQQALTEMTTAVAIQQVQENAASTVHSFDPDVTPQVKREEAERNIPADMLPDFRNLGNKRGGLQTELGSSNVDDIKQALSAAQKKPVIAPVKVGTRTTPKSPSTPRTPRTPAAGGTVSTRIPEWYKVGWTAFSTMPNPGGALLLAATESKPRDPIARTVSILLYADWLRDLGPIFVIGVVFWLLGTLGGGIITYAVGCLFVATYYQISTRRFQRHARDDIARELTKTRFLEANVESVEWLNSFLQKFWLIFEPVMSAYVIENIDTYLVDYLPGFLDSVRLTTFTLGTKPFRVESVRTLQEASPDTVCMDWRVSFIPNDTSDMTKKQLENKVNPKVVLTIRLGKGMVGAGIPVLVEDMSFKGQMRVKLQFMSKFPHIRMVEACFLQKPKFDYVLKPIGGETFGFDVTNIPGLQSFVRDQVHAILGPMMYYPNVFAFDVERFFSGELDISQANGVLAVTVYSTTLISGRDISGNISPFIRFYLDKAQELGRTSVQENTLEPRWNETHFLLVNNLQSVLSFELRSHSGSSKDRRIARAHFDLRELERDGEYDYAREGLELDLLHAGKAVSQLKVDMRYMPVSKPVVRGDGTIEPAAESNSGILRFTVHECRNLGSIRLNPYVRVTINGTERMKTPVFKRNQNPKFERSGEVVVLDQTAVYIRVEVKDSTSFADDPTIGVWRSYLVDMMQQLPSNDGWWDLQLDNGSKAAGRIRLSVQWKPVVMTGLSSTIGGHGLYAPPIGVVRITFWRARDLKNVEGVASKSDPYVRVRSGAQVLARTEVIDNNLDPEWGETQYVPVRSHKEEFILEVMDWNAKTKDKSLGYTILRVKDLVKQRVEDRQDGVEPQKWYESTGQTIDQWAPLRSTDRTSTKGEIRYTAEFHPTVAMPRVQETGDEESDAVEKEEPTRVLPEVPPRDLHGFPIRYTPDNLVDLFAYNSGVLIVKIHEVRLPRVAHVYCQLLVDSLLPQYQTRKIKGRTLALNETCDAFVKEADFSRVAIEIKPADADEKDDSKVAFWINPVSMIIRHIQARRRRGESRDEDGEWFDLMGMTEPGGKIRLSFDYEPLANFTLNPDESLDNQGQLTVTLLDAKDLMAADKSGTSDPYVVFTVNGERVHKSATIKKTLNPVWKNETFTVPIQSRVTASFRIEVFDWNQFLGDIPLGSGGISLRGDLVESFIARQVKIPLDGVAGVSGHVRVRFLWQPQLLIRKKTHTSVLADKRTYTNIGTSTNLSPKSPTFGTTPFPISGATMHPTTVAQSSDTISYLQRAPSLAPSPSSSTSSSALKSSVNTVQNPLARQDSLHKRNISVASSILSTGQSRPSVDTASVMDESQMPGDDTATGSDGTVTIHVIEARNLRGVDKSGTSDPFLRVRIGKHQVYKTKYIKKTLTPEWNESFKYSVTSRPTTIDFKVKDHNRFSHSVDLGQCQWNLWDLIKPQQQITSIDKWLPLYPVGHGEIHIRIEFGPS